MNILKHSIYKAIYDLCCEIEKLPASEQQTKVAVMAGSLEKNADQIVDALRDALTPYRDDDKTIRVTEERMEAWQRAAEVS
jgi:ABC-type xylose transport system substrate-binding protein